MTIQEERRQRRTLQQQVRRMSKRACGNPACFRPGKAMISWGSQRIPICKECKTLLQSGRGLPAEPEIQPFLKVALMLAEEDDTGSVDFEFPVAEFRTAVQACHDICASILIPERKELTEEEEHLRSIGESEAMEEYLSGRLG